MDTIYGMTQEPDSKTAKAMTGSEKYATTQEMAERYRIGADTVRRKASSGEWPCERIGRLYRFSPAHQDEIAQILAGTVRGGYDKDRIAVALRQLSG